MNFRSTGLLFGLLMGMLWLFGLMLAYKKTAVDESFILPTLQKAPPDTVMETLTITRKAGGQAEEIQFAQAKEIWSFKQPGAKNAVRVESFRITKMINQLKEARKYEDAGVSDNLTLYELDRPATVVTLRGTIPGPKDETKEWKLNIGKESGDKILVYVNSSDRSNRVFAVAKSSIDSLFFQDPNHLRSRQIFEFTEASVKNIDLKEGAAELQLKKGDDGLWRFKKPPYGLADFEGPAPPKELPPNIKLPEGGVKGLLAAIGSMRVDSEDDFVPSSNVDLANFGLEEGKETLRIQIGSGAGDKKELSTETLFIGLRAKEKGRNQVFARLLGDLGVFKLNAKILEPIQNALKEPGKLRSLDVTNVDAKKVDVVSLRQGKDEVKLLHPEGKPWEIQDGAEKPKKANDKAVQALLEAVQGKGDIQKFFDEGDAKKLDAELGLENPALEVSLFVDSLDKEKKDADKDKKEPEKNDAKEKDGKDQKTEKKDEGPRLKKDAKAAVVLSFGKEDKDSVNVKRVLADGTVSRFTVPKTLVEKVLPGDLHLAYLDTALPEVATHEVERLELARGKDKIEVEKGWGEKANRWQFKGTQDPADAGKTTTMIQNLLGLQAKKWLKKIAAGEDLDKYGLKTPALRVALNLKKDRLQPAGTASLLGLLAAPGDLRFLGASATVAANQQADKGETVVLKLGKETDQDKDKPGVFAQRSDKDLLFLVPADLVKYLREADLRDRSGFLIGQPLVTAGVVGLAAAEPSSGLLAGSPLVTTQVHGFDAAKVKEIKLAVRTPDELRIFAFQRDPQAKDKAWQDKSGLQEFTLDSAKVNQWLEQLGKLKAERWVSLGGAPKTEQKLSAKDAALRIELVFDDGKTLNLTVGAPFENQGYFAQTSAWPDAIFYLPASWVSPLQRGPAYFAKERVTAES